MSSLEIASITDKQHRNVLRDIRNQCKQLDLDVRGFEHTTTDSYGRGRITYNLDKTNCLILATGYDIKLRTKLINRWLELEQEQLHPKPMNDIEKYTALLEQANEIERLNLENIQLTVKQNKGYKAQNNKKRIAMDKIKAVGDIVRDKDIVPTIEVWKKDSEELRLRKERYLLKKQYQQEQEQLEQEQIQQPNKKYVSVSEMGRAVQLSGAKMNNLLEKNGMQFFKRDGNNAKVWYVTEKGSEFVRATDKKVGNGNYQFTVTTLSWCADVLTAIDYSL